MKLDGRNFWLFWHCKMHYSSPYPSCDHSFLQTCSSLLALHHIINAISPRTSQDNNEIRPLVFWKTNTYSIVFKRIKDSFVDNTASDVFMTVWREGNKPHSHISTYISSERQRERYCMALILWEHILLRSNSFDVENIHYPISSCFNV